MGLPAAAAAQQGRVSRARPTGATELHPSEPRDTGRPPHVCGTSVPRPVYDYHISRHLARKRPPPRPEPHGKLIKLISCTESRQRCSRRLQPVRRGGRLQPATLARVAVGGGASRPPPAASVPAAAAIYRTRRKTGNCNATWEGSGAGRGRRPETAGSQPLTAVHRPLSTNCILSIGRGGHLPPASD